MRTARPARRPAPLGRGVAVVLLVGAARSGWSGCPASCPGRPTRRPTARDIPRVGAVPVLPGPKRTEFLAYVRRTVPAAESVRIVQAVTPVSPLEARAGGQPGICGYSVSRLQYFWLVYALVPRPSTCDPAARWTVYFGVPPAAVPAGVARAFAPGYALVRQ